MFVWARSQNHLKVARKSKILVALPKKIRSSSIGYNHMSHDARKSDCVACIKQRRRPACANAQAGQRLSYSFPARNDI